jgi:hypothetical protein
LLTIVPGSWVIVFYRIPFKPAPIEIPQKMSFVTPKWNATEQHYVIEADPEIRKTHTVTIERDTSGSTVFKDENEVHDITVELIHDFIEEGEVNKWFTKLPSHEQLMKRLRHTFASLATPENNTAFVHSVLMTPKTLTVVWMPTTVKPEVQLPPLEFEDSDGDGLESEPELSESKLPPVELRDPMKQTKEEYLLTRLRAARARVEAEEIKMQYFESTGKMPPDSESEEDDE